MLVTAETKVFGNPDLAHHSKETEFQYGKGEYMSTTELWLTSVWSIGWSGTLLKNVALFLACTPPCNDVRLCGTWSP